MAQIVKALKRKIRSGELDKNNRLPSINSFSRQYGVSRDTIEKAYNLLKAEGYIASIKGKGYFVAPRRAGDFKVLFILNELGFYQRSKPDKLLFEPAGKINMDLEVYHNDLKRFREIVSENLRSYQYYYVVLPRARSVAKQRQINDIVDLIPETKRLVLQEKE